jgi:hypothetical protein
MRAKYPSEIWRTVDACFECNATLSAHDLPNVALRKQYLFYVYLRKYDRLLKLPAWSEEDLERLDGCLRIYVERSLKERTDVQARLRMLAE